MRRLRAAVISAYQTYLEKRWVDQLKSKYTVKVNEKGNNTFISNWLKRSSWLGMLLLLVSCDLIKMKQEAPAADSGRIPVARVNH